ncbi:hypothetical protein [Flammeovirga sp. SJP92]|uniref:hypothetical protein n=1 Tax=Flammeovirga sp. SJP92 TaxID=1775430 RepID=UPI000786F8C3|nr:hypothetical protein [Flammeovirga sp. SJP92]KXX71028.1 hypothetical protein AVL50_10525 [Flammeovirga sp. SJP92]
MEIKEIKDRVKIEHNRELIDKVKEQLHREKRMRQVLSIFAKSFSIFLLLVFFHLANQVKVHQFILEQVNKAYINVETIERSRLITYSLQGVAMELKQGNYSDAKEILKELPQSHHKDWFVSLTYLGLKDFETSQEYLVKISTQTDHLYHDNIDYTFCMKYHVIQVRNFYDQEGKKYLGRTAE